MKNKIVFVADIFSEDYAGGAELTTQALIEKCPLPYTKLHARDVTQQHIKENSDSLWVFGNFSSINFNLIPEIAGNLKYVVLEYDYKFCRFRSIEKHQTETGNPCDCHDQPIGKLVSAFYYAASHVFWMSAAQRDRYIERFPFLEDMHTTVLSSVFSDDFFQKIDSMKTDASREGWIVLGSGSWIKGADEAEEWCKDNGKPYEVVWNLPYDQILDKMTRAEGFVYLPKGGDTCPRMVIEAKLLGCQLEINDNVQHAEEEWFQMSSGDISDYLKSRPMVFWGLIDKIIQNEPRISGYTTAYDCIKNEYPYEDSIRSMLGFCDEVVVVDGGSTDGTWEHLTKWASEEPRLKIIQNIRDWGHKRFAVFDGDQKAVARSHCTGDFCWQMDADEILPPSDWEKVHNICKNFPKGTSLVSLPVVEYWGTKEKVRMDINPWKWRLSRNIPTITHGIPAPLRRYDSEGQLYSLHGTDGCDYIHSKSGAYIPNANFYTEEAHRVRVAAISGSIEAQNAYQVWFKHVVDVLPSIRHHSWLNIERKIRTYKEYWQRHWESLYDVKQDDTAENNMFFDKPWNEVTEEEIKNLAGRLSRELGGHIFHKKINWSKKTPHIVGIL
jgi:glycosyltransferase involved in cell wall biosynthesis